MAKSLKEEFTKGIIKENPVLRLMLGRFTSVGSLDRGFQTL